MTAASEISSSTILHLLPCFSIQSIIYLTHSKRLSRFVSIESYIILYNWSNSKESQLEIASRDEMLYCFSVCVFFFFFFLSFAVIQEPVQKLPYLKSNQYCCRSQSTHNFTRMRCCVNSIFRGILGGSYKAANRDNFNWSDFFVCKTCQFKQSTTTN